MQPHDDTRTKRMVSIPMFSSLTAMCDSDNTSLPPLPPNGAAKYSSSSQKREDCVHHPSWVRRAVLSKIGIPLPLPRVIAPKDPSLTLPYRFLQQRQRDERKMRELLEEKAPTLQGDPKKIQALGEELFEVTYGKGVTAQQREDFLLKYGCTGWNDQVLHFIVQMCEDRGIVEMGAGHGQWARALTQAYSKRQESKEQKQQVDATHQRPKKQFDFVLAYDDHSNLPLNTHIYNAYTQPHHDFFGGVRKLQSKNEMLKILRSWSCRGRVLLLVYPPPGKMAAEVIQNYVEAAPNDNDTVIFVGEGRGGANGDNSFFDFIEDGTWMLTAHMDVQRPPGDKGYEKLYMFQRRKQDAI